MTPHRLLKLTLVAALCAGLQACAVVDRVKSDMAIERAESAYTQGDASAAADAYRTAADSGGGYAAYMLSWMYLSGEGMKKNLPEGRLWMERAAELDYAPAIYTLGIWALKGQRGVKRDSAEGARLIRKAAEMNDPPSMYLLGLLYAKGTGVERDRSEATRWFQRADEHGFPVQQNLLTGQTGSGRSASSVGVSLTATIEPPMIGI